jgi:hypothetical protein
MRLLKYLKEDWEYQAGYAGRGIIKSVFSQDVIVWILLEVPSELGLLWTLPDGITYLNNKYIGKVNIGDTSKTTHKKVLASLYDELGYDEEQGDLRVNVESWYELNVRGRIIRNEIYIYDDVDSGNWKNRMRKAQSLIKRYIKSDWYKR